MSCDEINSIFQSAIAIFVLVNCWVLDKEKCAKGISLLSNTFFACNALFNVFYYSRLNQPLSFYFGIWLFICNIVYFGLIAKYKFFRK